MTISIINTIDAKEDFTEIINRVAHYKEHILLTRRGKEIAAIIPIEDFESLQQSLDQKDLNDAVDALKEARSMGSITLDELKKSIGES